MLANILKAQLEPIAEKQRALRRWKGWAVCWGVAAVTLAGLLAAALLFQIFIPALVYFVIALALAAAFLVKKKVGRDQTDYQAMARQIEAENPELKSLVLTAAEQEPDPATGRMNYLQQRVILEAFQKSRKSLWDKKDSERLVYTQCAALAMMGLFALVGSAFVAVKPSAKMPRLFVAPGITVTPGDAQVEKGSGFSVLARFEKMDPAQVQLLVHATNGETRALAMSRSMDDPLFGATLPEVQTDFTYEVDYGGARTKAFKVSVYTHPDLERADALLKYPAYTGLERKTIEDTRRISAVEGTEIDYTFILNKPVKTAQLVAKDKTVIPLAATASNAQYRATINLDRNQRYELLLVDQQGRTNKIPPEFVFQAQPNREPELKLASPKGDQRVSSLEEIAFQAETWDDFGLRKFGLAYSVGGDEPKSIDLGQEAGALEKRSLKYLLSLEELSTEPGQLVSYYVWAEDIGPSGQIRRSASDMYFAEIRPFEEIFREGGGDESGESQQQGQQGQSPSDKLTDLQKQIINATWKVQRQERGPKPGQNFKKDMDVIEESQSKALEQARALGQRAEDPASKKLIEPVITHMEKAVQQLSASGSKEDLKLLPQALAAEQAAYQALLKLQAREYQVSRNRSRGGGGGGGGQRAQQQLDQLELKQSENRYETQRQASQEQSGTSEELQVLNRLKELARRQEDMNERLRELQTALQEAKTEQEREELRRQLKRLRDEQREMVQDMDELRQRMERLNSPNSPEAAQALSQLDQSREQARQAAEQLESGSVSQALASGARAEQQLEELRDDYRKKTSSQFSDEMREMRNEAREMEKRQEQVKQKMNDLTQAQRKTLSDSGERQALSQMLDQQKRELTNIVQDMKRVTEAAEVAEPLLSKQLYDTLRKHGQDNTERSLDYTSELLKRNFLTQAEQYEQRASQGIQQLASGIERAAESILGDEAEALRRANRDLQNLAERLEKEMARNGFGPGGTNGPAGTGLISSNAVSQLGAGVDPNQSTNRAGLAAGERDGNPSGLASTNGVGRQMARAGQSGRPGSQRGENQSQESNSSQSGQGNEGQSGQGSQSGQRQLGQRSGQGQNSGAQAQNQGGQPGEEGQPGQAGQQGQPGQGGQGGRNQRQMAANSPQGRGGSQGGENDQPGEQNGENQRGGNRGASQNRGGRANFLEAGSGPAGNEGPLTGADFSRWSGQLLDVQEMLDSPELRAQLSQVLDRARAIRAEFKRHSKEPEWAMVELELVKPLTEIQSRVAEELLKTQSKEALAPIDRDPVPAKYSELVRDYYERLGKE